MACHHNQESQDVFAALDGNYGDYYGGYGYGGDYGYGDYGLNYGGGGTDSSSTANNDAINSNDKFVSDLMAFWDTYLVYNDDDFAEYLYEFPKYVAEKQLESVYGYEDPDIWNVTDDSHQSASQNVTASADVNDYYGANYGGYGMEEIQKIIDQLY